MQWFKKAILFAGIGICAIGSISAPAKAEQTGTFMGRPIFDNNFGGIEIQEGGTDDSVTKRSAGYARQYDPRALGLVSNVEDQGMTNTCWAFSTLAAIESNLIKKGYENNSVNLSENHLAYFFYNRETDPVGYTAGDKNYIVTPLTDWEQNGGTLQGTALALTTWAGVVRQTAPEFNEQGLFINKALPAGTCYNRDYVVNNVYMLGSYNVNVVKQAIMDYGAVASGIYMDENYLSADQKSYYYPIENGNHAVAIVGWDDDYSRSNFTGATMPLNNGAWIVKNSWGTGIHDGGYMYVSYEDASLCELVAFDMVRATETNHNNYQYDGTANPGYVGFNSGVTYANVFQAKGTPDGCNELLTAVSVNTFTTNVAYSLQIYTGVTGTDDPTNGKAMFSTPQTGVLTNAGYCRIDLAQPVTVTPGEKYAVVMKLSAANGGAVYVGVESNYSNEWIGFYTDIDTDVGYIASDDKWYDCGDAIDMIGVGTFNIRIKAYTSNTAEKTTYALSDKSLGVSKGSSAKLSLDISTPSVKRKVKWSSSNKKVATVSSSGRVKGKAYGTATIKAKFVAGSKTKTLKCKVTVGPEKVKSFKAKGSKKKVTVTWKKSGDASGYVLYYSKNKTSGYKKLTTIKTGSTTKYTKKLKKGTYYVKMRPYITKDGKKLYGSYTSVKTVKVK